MIEFNKCKYSGSNLKKSFFNAIFREINLNSLFFPFSVLQRKCSQPYLWPEPKKIKPKSYPILPKNPDWWVLSEDWSFFPTECGKLGIFPTTLIFRVIKSSKSRTWKMTIFHIFRDFFFVFRQIWHFQKAEILKDENSLRLKLPKWSFLKLKICFNWLHWKFEW